MDMELLVALVLRNQIQLGMVAKVLVEASFLVGMLAATSNRSEWAWPLFLKVMEAVEASKCPTMQKL